MAILATETTEQKSKLEKSLFAEAKLPSHENRELNKILALRDTEKRDENLGMLISGLVNKGALSQAGELLEHFSDPILRESSLNEVSGQLALQKRPIEAEQLVNRFGIPEHLINNWAIIADSYLAVARTEGIVENTQQSLIKARELSLRCPADLARDFQLGEIALVACEKGKVDFAVDCLREIADLNVRDDINGAVAVRSIELKDKQNARGFCQAIQDLAYRQQVSRYVEGEAENRPDLGSVIFEGKRGELMVAMPTLP